MQNNVFRRSAKNIQNIPQKWPNKNCAKRPPNFRDHLLYFSSRIPNLQHNALILLKLKITHQSIKVRSRKWRKRTLKNEWCNIFSNLFSIFQKRTFINVHFSFFSFRFEKNVNFLTQTIMLSFAFLSWKICYDNFLDIL